MDQFLRLVAQGIYQYFAFTGGGSEGVMTLSYETWHCFYWFCQFLYNKTQGQLSDHS